MTVYGIGTGRSRESKLTLEVSKLMIFMLTQLLTPVNDIHTLEPHPQVNGIKYIEPQPTIYTY